MSTKDNLPPQFTSSLTLLPQQVQQQVAEDAGAVEQTFDYQEVHDLAKQDLDFLAGIALPEIYKYAFPDLYLQAWALLRNLLSLKRDFSQVALGLPRGFAKTLVLKLLILYIILYTDRRFILVICENEDKAKSILADVQDMLDEPNIKAIYGDWRTGLDSATLTRKKFAYRGRDIILKAAGAGTGIRGITEKNRRPDVMIFDDIQSREDAESDVLSKQLETWMVGTAMKAKSPEGCLYLFVANMYPVKGSLLRKLKQNANWIKFIVGGILANGQSLWEELQPIKQLLKEFMNDLAAGQPQVFYAEVLNDENASVNTALSLDKIPPYPFDEYEINAGAYVVIDPASDKANSDDVSIMGFVVHDGRPVARAVKAGKFNPGDTIRNAIQMCAALQASLLVIEGTAYQYSLKYWSEQIFLQLGITGIQVIDMYSGKNSKNTRILDMFKLLVPGKPLDPDSPPRDPELLIHPDVRAAVYDQLTSFDPLRRDNTDGLLDCLTYAPRVLQEFGHLIAINTDVVDDALLSQDEYDEVHNSPF